VAFIATVAPYWPPMARRSSVEAITVVPIGRAPEKRLSLHVVGSGILGSHPLPARGEVVIGRGEECDLRIDEESISRRHAAVAVDGDRVRLRDLGSANGTRIGDQPLVAGESIELAPGDVVDLGSVMLVLQRGYSDRRTRRFLPHGYFEARLEEECDAGGAAGQFALIRFRLEQVSSTAVAEETLAEVLRAVDIAGRYGPSEYEVLLPGVGADDARRFVARVQGGLAAGGVIADGGVALYPRDGRTAGSLLTIANEALAGRRRDDGGPRSVVAADPAMQRVARLIDRVAPGQIGVLVLGETGVGKEVAAEMIHRASPRASGPFLRLNCGGFSETLLDSELFGHEKGAFTGAVQAKPGLLESADGGTVLLDEIGDLPASLQVKLLRVLEDRQVMRIGALRPRTIDVRFVAATNRDLEQEVARGRFREDLYYRVAGVTIVIPPLRERPGDIAPLADLFAGRAARQAGLPPPAFAGEVLELLADYAWPGNIRELRNAMERAVLLAGGGPILAEHLPLEKLLGSGTAPSAERPAASAAEPLTLRDARDAEERRRIVEALESCAGNQTRAARLLGIARSTLQARIEQYAIPRPRKR